MNGAYFLYPNIKDRLLILEAGNDYDIMSTKPRFSIDWFSISAGHEVYAIPSDNLDREFYDYVSTIRGRMVMLIDINHKTVNVIFNNKKDEAVFILKYID